jgi:hypothetical protein
MKVVAILLLLPMLLSVGGCGNNNKVVQVASGTVWSASFLGGKSDSSGFSFITQFTTNAGGALDISNFQLDNSDTCFGTATLPVPTGTLMVTTNSADQASGTFTMTITSAAGDTVTLTSSEITGTVNTTTTPYTLTGGIITGTWALVPASGSSCVATSGNDFTMTEGTTT